MSEMMSKLVMQQKPVQFVAVMLRMQSGISRISHRVSVLAIGESKVALCTFPNIKLSCALTCLTGGLASSSLRASCLACPESDGRATRSC